MKYVIEMLREKKEKTKQDYDDFVISGEVNINSAAAKQAKMIYDDCTEAIKILTTNSNARQRSLPLSHVSGLLANCLNCGQELQLEVKEMTNSDIIDALQANNR